MMPQSRETLIAQLTTQLPPVKTVRLGTATVALWLALGTALVILMTLAVQPFRPGVWEQLLSVPHFALETGLGVIAIGLMGAAGLKTAIPGSNASGLLCWALVVAGLWVGSYVLGLFFPTLESSMEGKRPHCVWETLLYSIPTLALGLWLTGRGYVLDWPRTAVIMGATAGAIPALLMQLACMYGAKHILLAHIAPVVPVALLGLAIGLLIRRRA